ncbi:MAG: radical SAM family heme chaperone HemW [Sedimenticola sp.]|nr:radical SAM family heme chaperone HemW [Sedimenticola sp.]
MNDDRPLALYIHLPWCVRKCPYCDFNSHQAPAGLDHDAYIDALLRDLDFELESLRGRSRVVQTIFIGGGTPSLFPARAIGRLLGGIRLRMTCEEEIEVTLEANPGTLEHDRFEGYREAGVNRLSIGVQSFDSGCLRRLGRIHGADEARQAVFLARKAGFENINIDLMCGLPGQSMQMALEDVSAAVAENPEHISYYQLTLEPNTPFYHHPPDSLPGHDQEYRLLSEGRRMLANAGYVQYEISAFSRPGLQCRHNLNYWRFGDYIGVGAGAHGKISVDGGARVIRRWRVKSPGRYQSLAGSAEVLGGERQLNPDDLVVEFMMNALRLRSGFPPGLFSRSTGCGEDLLWSRLQRPMARGLVRIEKGCVRATGLGWRFLDELLTEFLA